MAARDDLWENSTSPMFFSRQMLPDDGSSSIAATAPYLDSAAIHSKLRRKLSASSNRAFVYMPDTRGRIRLCLRVAKTLK